MRGVGVVAALAAMVALAGPADATHRYSPTRDGLVVETYTLTVHDAPNETDGGGSWAWTWVGYHPNGWQVMAKSPSRAALTIRNLELGDKITLDGLVAGTFTVTDVDATVYPWTSVGENNVVFSVERPSGSVYKAVAVSDG